MALLTGASNIGASAKTSLKGRKKTSVTMAKSLATNQSPVTIGATLPRSVRVRLGKSGERKHHPKSAVAADVSTKATANMIGGTSWLAEMVADMGFTDLPEVMYSDTRGIFHASLDTPSAAPDMAGMRRQLAAPLQAASSRQDFPRKATHLSALWNSKRGAGNVKSMHQIQQARPRAMSH